MIMEKNLIKLLAFTLERWGAKEYFRDVGASDGRGK